MDRKRLDTKYITENNSIKNIKPIFQKSVSDIGPTNKTKDITINESIKSVKSENNKQFKNDDTISLDISDIVIENKPKTLPRKTIVFDYDIENGIPSNVPQNNQLNVQSNVQPNVQPNVPPNVQPNVPQNNQLNVPQNNQLNVPQNNQLNVPQNNQLNIPSNVPLQRESNENDDESDDTYNTDAFNATKTRIVNELLEPAYYNDVKDTLEWRYKWRKIANTTESFSQLLIGGSTICAFAAGFFNYTKLSFVAGSLTVAAGILMKLTAYSNNESKERTQSLNIILDDLHIKKMPSINVNNNPNVANNTNNV